MRATSRRYAILLVLALAVATIVGMTGGGSAATAASDPSISINDVAMPEGNSGNTTFVFTVTLSQPSTKSVKVDYQTVNGTATLGSDFNPSQGSLSFAPGQTSLTIGVVVRGDTTYEPDETFFVNLSNPRFATIGDGQGQGTIVNDDQPTPALSINDVTVTEGNSGTTPATFTVKLTSPAASDVTFDIATQDNTATAPSDYTARQVLGATIPAGQQTYSFTVSVNGDTISEPDESFFVNITNPSGGIAIADGQGIGTITNDDGTVGGGGPSISITDPTLPEGNSGTTTFPFTVTLSQPSKQQVSVSYATANGTATAPSDYQSTNGQLTFKKGETSKTINVLVYGDTISEPNETFFVDLSNPQNATLAQGQAVGTITNDDNQPPTAAGQSQTTLEDTPIQLTLTGGDPEGAAVSFAIATNPSHGSLGSIGTPSCSGSPSVCQADVTYTPDANYNGTDSFTFTTNDGNTDSAPATVSLTITAVNDAPSFTLPASPDQSVGNDAGAQTVSGFASNISAGPADEAGQTLSFHVSNTNPALFTVQPAIDPASGDLTYTPSSSVHGTTTVSVYLTDNGGTANGGVDTSGTQTFTITSTQPNRAPSADSQSVTTDEDTAKTITLTGGDPDGNALTFSIVSGPSHGSLGSIGAPSCSGTPSVCQADVTYTPDANYNGGDSFTFKTNDGTVDSTTNGTVSITVNPVDDPPVAVNDSKTLLEDASATTIDVLANDTDIDGGPKYVASVTQPSNGTVVITNAGADLTYQPAADFCGADSFTYTLNGGSTATVNVTVTCVNDPPSFTKGADQTSLSNQNADGSAKAYTVSGWATNISAGPADESAQTLTFHVSNDNNALFTVQPAVDPTTGDLTFTTDPTASGSTTVSVYLTDNGGTANGGVDTSGTQTFTISTVFPSPIAVDDSYAATGNIRINVNAAAEGVLQRGTDDTLFGGSLHGFGATSGTADGTVPNGSNSVTTANGGTVVLAGDGTFTYDPPAGYTGADDSFYYDLHNAAGDAVGHVTITIGGMIWFVDNAAGSAGDGRLDHPFNTLAGFQIVNDGIGTHPNANQPIFLYTGSGAYTGGVTLLGGQELFGQGATASLATLTGITLAPFSDSFPATGGTAPSLTTSSGTVNAITLGSGNTVRGLTIGNTTGNGIAGSSFGTLTLSEVSISGSGQALNLDTGTANASFGSVSSSSGTNGIRLNAVGGTLSFGSGGTLTGSSGDELVVNGGSNSWTYPGAITNTGSNRAVNISNRTGGTITLSGQITDTGGSGDGISLTSNTGATVTVSGGVALSTGATGAFTATGGGTVNVSGSSNTLATTTGTALNVANTTIGSSGLNFKSIAANGAVNGIVLNTTGASGSLVVTGNGDTSVGGDSSGGVIQSTSGHGISLNSTLSPSFTNMSIHDTGGSGINGTNVTNFTFANGTINNSGNALGEANIAFNGSGALSGNNIQGTLSVTNSSLTNAFDSGVFVENDAGTIGNATITGNTITSSTSTTTSKGTGIDLVGIGNASTASTLTKATISGNTIRNFPSGAGIQVIYGNASITGPAGSAGTAGDATNVITIINNTVQGFDATNRFGTDAIAISAAGGNSAQRGQGNFNVSSNDARNSLGTVILIGNNGYATMTATVNNNTVVGNNTVASNGIGGGNGIVSSTAETPLLTLTTSGNTVSQTDGNGILLVSRGVTGQANLTIKNNTVAAPLSGVRPGIRVDAGNSASVDDAVCLDIESNTTAGSSSGGITAAGIGLRKQGTVATTNDFGIEGMIATSSPGIEQYVGNAGKNPASANGVGDGSIDGVLLISATSGFSNCNTAP